MLLLSSKEGIIRVLEDPDESDESMVVLDIENRICHNGERGLQSIRPHPDFAENRYIYLIALSNPYSFKKMSDFIICICTSCSKKNP